MFWCLYFSYTSRTFLYTFLLHVYIHLYTFLLHVYIHLYTSRTCNFEKKTRVSKEVCGMEKKFVDLDIFACLKNTNLKSWFLGFEKICGFQKKIHGFRKSSWIWITICISKKFVNLKDVQEFDCFSYFEKVHEFEKRRTEKWKRKTAPEKTCGTFYPWDEKNKNRCGRV